MARYIVGMPKTPFALLALILTTVSCTPVTTPSSPTLGPPASGDINPGRGYFQWSGMQVVPPHAKEKAAPDLYKRFTWVDLEPTAGSYDFTALTTLFDKNLGSRVSFRIRAMVDYGTANLAGAIPRFVPSSVPGWEADTSGDGEADVFIPDWNSEAFLGGVEKLFAALKTELDKAGPDGKARSSRIGWIDVGMFGQYGEWYLRTAPSSSGTSPWVDYSQAPPGMVPFEAFADTAGNARKRLVDAQISAFPAARWVMFFLYDQREVLNYLFHVQKITTLPVGWRFDALGSDQFLEKQWQTSGGKPDAAKSAWWNGIPGRPAFSERWKVAPVVAEFFGPGCDPVAALDQVRAFHVGQVGNGNFTFGSGTDAAHWSALPGDRRIAWAAVGTAAGWRLQAAGPGTLNVSAGQFTWTGQVTNPGSSPAWESWGARFMFDQGTPVDVAASQAFPLPGETLTLTLTGALPAGITSPQAWSWVPTIRGTAASWTGPGPASR